MVFLLKYKCYALNIYSPGHRRFALLHVAHYSKGVTRLSYGNISHVSIIELSRIMKGVIMK